MSFTLIFIVYLLVGSCIDTIASFKEYPYSLIVIYQEILTDLLQLKLHPSITHNMRNVILSSSQLLTSSI